MLIDNVRPDEERTIEVVLAGRISVSGLVRALDNKTPVTGVFIEAFELLEDGSMGPVRGSDLTDHLGSYELYDLPKGTYLLKVGANEILQQIANDPLEDGSPLQVERQITITDPTFLQRVDFRCLPQEEGVWDHFSTFDGIPGVPVFSVRADEQEGIWVGYSTWIRRYVGQAFREIESSHRNTEVFSSFASTPGGGLCAGVIDTSAGKSRLKFFYQNKTVGSFPTPDSAPVIKIIFGKSNQLWAQAQGKVFFVSDWRKALANETEVPPWQQLEIESVDAIAVGPLDDLWVVNAHGIIHLLEGTKKTYDDKHGLRNLMIRDSLVTDNGFLWLATSKGLGVLSEDHFEWYLDHFPDGGSDLTSLAAAGPDEVWVGTRANGLFRVSKKGIQNHKDHQISFDNYIHQISEGPGDTLWLATQNGVSRYRNRQMRVYTQADGLPKSPIFTVGVDRTSEHVWVGMEWAGPAYFDGSRFRTLSATHQLANSYFRNSGYTPDGDLWMCGNLGVLMVDHHELTLLPKHPDLDMQDYYLQCAFGPNEDVWIGRGWAGGGLIHQDLSGQTFQVFGQDDGLPNHNIWALDVDQRGQLRIGTTSGLV